jgi:hypothetical protein
MKMEYDEGFVGMPETIRIPTPAELDGGNVLDLTYQVTANQSHLHATEDNLRPGQFALDSGILA